LSVLAVVTLLALAVAAVLLMPPRGEDVVTTGSPAGTASAPAGPTAGPATTPAPAPLVDCSVPPPAAAFTAGTADPCFTVMGERMLVWLGANAAGSGGTYTPSDTFSAADAENVTRVQRLMGDSPDGWLGPEQWSRLMNEAAPPVTELRASGIGPLWFGMNGEQVTASGVATVVTGTTDAPRTYVEVDGVDGAGCYADTAEGGRFATFATTDADVRTPEGIGPLSSVADLQATYGSLLRVRTLPSSPQDVTLYVLPDSSGRYALAFWPATPEVGKGTPLALYAGEAEAIAQLHPQSGWCFD
jgi:hypothetical protein